MVVPTPQAPITRRISKQEIYRPQNRYIKVGESVGYDKPFNNKIWDDDLTWNDLFNWDE